MWFLKRSRTFESVLRELVEGLENGTIVLTKPAAGQLPPAEIKTDAPPVERTEVEHAKRPA